MKHTKQSLYNKMLSILKYSSFLTLTFFLSLFICKCRVSFRHKNPNNETKRTRETERHIFFFFEEKVKNKKKKLWYDVNVKTTPRAAAFILRLLFRCSSSSLWFGSLSKTWWYKTWTIKQQLTTWRSRWLIGRCRTAPASHAKRRANNQRKKLEMGFFSFFLIFLLRDILLTSSHYTFSRWILSGACRYTQRRYMERLCFIFFIFLCRSVTVRVHIKWHKASAHRTVDRISF